MRAPALRSPLAALCRWRGLSSSSSAPGTPWVRHAGEGALLLRFGHAIDVEVSQRQHAPSADQLQPYAQPQGSHLGTTA